MRPRVLVTGGARRVGKAIALKLAASGFDVAVHFNRSEEEAAAVVDQCAELGADAFVVQGDLSTDSGCTRVIGAIGARWESLEALVNNASVFEPCAFEAIDRGAWDKMMQVNLYAPMALSRGLLPLLRASGAGLDGAPETQRGVVVHLCDIGAERPIKGYTPYSVSKAGLLMLVRSMAVELAPAIRTVGVSPGQVIWPEDYDDVKRDRLSRRIPLQRVGSPEDIASLVAFLLGEGHYINGEVIAVDGGLSCRY
jgi:pteridine reductase